MIAFARVRRLLFQIILVCASLAPLGVCANPPAIAIHYGATALPTELGPFDMVVVEPDHASALPSTQHGQEVVAYVSVAEVHPSRSYFKEIPPEWKLARNGDWKSDVIDQTPDGWPDFFAERVVGPLWKRGYRGFFLDTLDSYRLAEKFDEQAQQQGLVRVIETLHARFPGIQLILNRGFEIVPRVHDKIRMVAAESLYRGWSAKTRSYQEVGTTDRQWLAAQLRTVRDEWKLPVLVIDYVPPHDRELTRATAERIQADGFIPWVADSALETVGIGMIEPVPRHILVLYNGAESPALNYSNAHRFLQMPLNYMGYVVDYADVREPLPEGIGRDRYAGVATWFSGFIPEARRKSVAQWLQLRMTEGMPLAVVGDIGQSPEPRWARRLSIQTEPVETQGSLRIEAHHPMMGFEASLPLPTRNYQPAKLTDPEAAQFTPLVQLRDERGGTFVAGAIAPWGGFILDPYALIEVPGSDDARWVIDPFVFLTQALRLEPMPVPDTTTENGRRLLLAHVDGDGFPSLAEFPGSPFAAQVLLKDIFETYRIPQTMSVIESEVAPDGLYPNLSPKLEAIAKAMFQLPHIEIGSHTYSHPFLWDRSVRHGLFQDDKEAAYNLNIPGYTMDLAREIVGSTAYINRRLAPQGKQVKILQWSGDTAPGAKALEISSRAGLLNINGGDTSITRSNPSLTAVGALGIRKNGYLQVYAPITNENIYTNLWRGPFYGFERAIESFEMTDSPRRIKPVGIYYHVYSASKRAGLHALHKVYDWALARPLHPVHASEFAEKVQDFYGYAIAREKGGWRVRGNGALRTLRIPSGIAAPNLALSVGVVGIHPGIDGAYVALAGDSAFLAPTPQSTSTQASRPSLFEANGRIEKWQATEPGRLSFDLRAYVPLEFSLSGASHCRAKANGRAVTAQPRTAGQASDVQYFQLKDQRARVELECTGR